MSAAAWSMGLRPEEMMEQAREQLQTASVILNDLSARRDVSDEAMEMELRMQILWLTIAANKIHEAARQRAVISQARELYLRREGPGQ